MDTTRAGAWLVTLAIAACGPQTLERTRPFPQTAAGDAAMFGRGFTAATTTAVWVDLRRPAYVTVLRVFPGEPAQVVTEVEPGYHQIHLAAGTRRVTLPAAARGGRLTELAGQKPAIESQLECQTTPPPTDPGTASPAPLPPRRTLPPCAVHEPKTQHAWKAPEALGPHLLLMITSDSRVDLAALSRAINRTDALALDLQALTAEFLAGHPGAWAAYLAPVN